MVRVPSLYNQTTLSDDDFVTAFVARHGVLDALLRRLQFQDPHDGGGHHLLIGPRGMGKTSMLRRLAIAIGRDEALAQRYVPLNFREEQYNVLRVGDFWRNCGEALAEWADRNDRPELADRLDGALAGGDWSEDEPAAEAFHAEMARLGLRAVLLVDNLDLILDNLTDQDNWRLRHSLQMRDGPIMVGAATQPLAQTQDRAAAFYEFFQAHHLDPLDVEETERCMRALAGQRGEVGAHVIAVLDREPQRLRTLHTLTGGNPRILALIYRLLETSESDAAMADLEILLDQVTPYYKARVEDYQSPQQRAIIDAIALHWDPVLTSDLARRTNIPSTTLSPVLIKLVKDGLIEKVETSGAYNGHQLVERFFNIWYLMRHGTRRTKQKMRWLVAFLTCFYSAKELAEIAGRAKRAGTMEGWHADYASAFAMAIRQDRELHRNSLKTELALNATHDAVADDDAAVALIETATAAYKAGDFEKALGQLDRLLAEFAEKPDADEHLAQAIWTKGQVLGLMGDTDAKLALFEELVARFDGSDDDFVRKTVARAQLGIAEILLDREEAAPAIAILADIVRRFAADDSYVGRQHVIRSLRGLAQAYAMGGDEAGEERAFAEIEERFAKANEPRIEFYRAKAWVDRACRLAAAHHREEAFALYRETFQRWQDGSAKIIRELSSGLLKGAHLFYTQDALPEAVALLDMAIERYGDLTPDAIRRSHYENLIVIRAYRAHLLDIMDEDEAARAGFDDVIPKLRDMASLAMQIVLANVLMSRASQFSAQGQLEAELSDYGEIIERFADSEEPILHRLVARAYLNRGITYDHLDRLDEAARDYDASITWLEQEEDVEIQGRLVIAHTFRADIETQKGDYDEALAMIEQVLARFGNSTEMHTLRAVARAMNDKGMVLDSMEKEDLAVEAFDAVIARFGQAPDLDLRERAALAAAYKGRTLLSGTHYRAAMTAFEQALDLGRDAEDAEVIFALGEAGFRLCDLLIDEAGELGRAEQLLRELMPQDTDNAHLNLAWVGLLAGRLEAGQAHRSEIGDVSGPLVAVLDAALDLAQSNFGSSVDRLGLSLDSMLNDGRFGIGNDIDRFLRLAVQQGEGERLIAWFETQGYDDRAAPLVAAFRAYVRGASALLDVNPEVRGPANAIFDLLEAPRRGRQAKSRPPRRKRPSRARKRPS